MSLFLEIVLLYRCYEGKKCYPDLWIILNLKKTGLRLGQIEVDLNVSKEIKGPNGENTKLENQKIVKYAKNLKDSKKESSQNNYL